MCVDQGVGASTFLLLLGVYVVVRSGDCEMRGVMW